MSVPATGIFQPTYVPSDPPAMGLAGKASFADTLDNIEPTRAQLYREMSLR